MTGRWEIGAGGPGEGEGQGAGVRAPDQRGNGGRGPYDLRMATRAHLEIPAGQDFRFQVDVVGGPESLVGYVGTMKIRPSVDSATVLASYDSTQITVTNSTRKVSVVVPAATTAGYTWSKGVYDLVITGADGTYRLVEGTVWVSPAVTR